MERLLWFIFIRWSRNVAIACVISFTNAEPPAHTVEKQTWVVQPSNTRELCERCARGCVRLKDGRCVTASWKGCHADCAVHNQNTTVAESSYPAANLGWDPALLVHPQVLWSSAGTRDTGGSHSQPRFSAACFLSTFKHKARTTAVR